MTQISRRSFVATSISATILSASPRCWATEELPAQLSPFLQDNFAPVREEILASDLKVIGQLPPELNGMFLRNGPNPQFPPKANYHWFDGDGMLHGVHLRDGKASYRNRWVRTAAWNEANKAGKAIYPSVLDPPDLKLLARQLLKGELPFPNTANTALAWHHGKLLALWEGGPPHEIKVPSLETIGPYNFSGNLKHAFTAHPKVCPKTGELMFFGYSLLPPFLQYSVADRDGTIQSTTPIELPRSVMMHDMAITERHSLFIDCPAVFDPSAVSRTKSFLNYDPKYGARIGVLPRHAKGNEIKWFEIEPCFVFHIFNAYEAGDEIVLHGCRFPRYPDFVGFNAPVKAHELRQVVNSSLPIAYRWRLNLRTGETHETAIDDLDSEFPRVNEAFTGSKTRYGYAVGGGWSTLVKYDFEHQSRQKHELGKACVTGEGIFVPRPDATSEDEGWLLSFTHDRANETSELRVIDSRDMTSEPVARVRIPQRVPYGFHAIWLAGGS